MTWKDRIEAAGRATRDFPRYAMHARVHADEAATAGVIARLSDTDAGPHEVIQAALQLGLEVLAWESGINTEARGWHETVCDVLTIEDLEHAERSTAGALAVAEHDGRFEEALGLRSSVHALRKLLDEAMERARLDAHVVATRTAGEEPRE